MKKTLLIFTFFLLLFGCKKEEPTEPTEPIVREVKNTDFADPSLYIYMQNEYDTNKDYIFQVEEILAVKMIDLYKRKNFESFKGLELFVNLEVLNISGQKSINRDLKLTNPKLRSLKCSDMNILSIDVTALMELAEFDCSDNNYLRGLDLSKNVKLKELNCDYISHNNKEFERLDLSNNHELEKIFCRYTPINQINFSNCKKLKVLEYTGSSINTIYLNDCTALEYLNLYNSSISILDISKCKELKYLNAYILGLQSLNIANNTLLEDLHILLERYNSLDITNNINLKKITLFLSSSRTYKNPFIIYIKEGQVKPQIIEEYDYILDDYIRYEFQYK